MGENPISGRIVDHTIRLSSQTNNFTLQQTETGELYASKSAEDHSDGDIVCESELNSIQTPVITHSSDIQEDEPVENFSTCYIPLKKSNNSDLDERWYKKIDLRIEIFVKLESEALLEPIYYRVVLHNSDTIKQITQQSYLYTDPSEGNPVDEILFVCEPEGKMKLRQKYPYFDRLCKKLPTQSVEINPIRTIHDIGYFGFMGSLCTILALLLFTLTTQKYGPAVFGVICLILLPISVISAALQNVSVEVGQTDYYSSSAVYSKSGAIFPETEVVQNGSLEVESEEPDRRTLVELTQSSDNRVFAGTERQKEWTVPLQNGFAPKSVTELLYESGFENISDDTPTLTVSISETEPTESRVSVQTEEGEWIYRK